MIMRRLPVCVAVLAGFAALGGCSSEDEHTVSVDAVRQAAAEAKPAECPIKLDVPAALRSGGVDRTARLDSADASVSKSDKPAADPIAAQREGLSAIEAAAGADIECDYLIGDDALDVYLVATPAKGAMNLLAPQIAQDAGLTIDDLKSFLDSPPGLGDVKVVGGSVAVGGLSAGGLSGDGGDVVVMVSSTVPELHDDTLSAVAGTLINQVRF